VWFQQFSELDRISHGAGVVGQSVPGGRTRMWERPLAEYDDDDELQSTHDREDVDGQNKWSE